MKKIAKMFVLALVSLMAMGSSLALAFDAVSITKPANGVTVDGSVEVCMTTFGVQVEPAKKGVNMGKGHHHLLIDTGIPSNLGNPIGKDAQHIHMGDGSTCKTLKLSSGKHSIRALFAKGNHVPYNPPISDVIEVNVR